MSRRRSKPLPTPSAALARIARARPCMARLFFSSFSRVTCMTPSLISTATRSGRGTLFLPLGPSKWTTPESTVAFTLSPSVMGSFPMRLMMVLSVDGASVDVAEDLAANLLATGLGVRHDTAGGGEDGHAKPAQDAGDLEVSDVAAQARARDALETDDDRGTIRTVLQLHGHIVLGLLLVDHVVDDEALFLEDLEDLDLQAAGREREALVLGARGVADAGEEITHRVIHWHGRDCLLSAWCVRLPHRLP